MLTDILEAPAALVLDRIHASGATAAFLHHNVTDESRWQEVIRETQATLGPLDILVNNAGIETAALVSECELADFRRVMDVNVTGVFLGLKHAVAAAMWPTTHQKVP
jgi:NAD(P)-dependent dehydrogenase (short-subunit alcohol dehydrogenase family)